MLRRDDRAVTVQIGAILMFGIVVIGLSVFQVAVVPQENKQVEFNSYVEATNDLSSLRNTLLSAGTAGTQGGTTVQTGVRYPARAVTINPPPVAGGLTTQSERTVRIDGAVAVSSEDASTRDIWNSTANGPRTYSTKSVRFAPSYNELDVPPVVVSPVAAYRVTDNGPIPLSSQSLVTGNRITLVTVDGDLSAVGESVTVEVQPVSTATRSVGITGDGEEFTISVPVDGDVNAFNESTLADELRANPNVRRTQVNGSNLDVVFDGDRTYELQLARVVVSSSDSASSVDQPDPAYLVPLTENGTAVPGDEPTGVSVEVRDAYNNPVEGADVSFTATDGSFSGDTTVTSGADGRATAQFALGDNDSATVTATLDDGGATPYNESAVVLRRQGAEGGTDDINPSDAGDVILEGAVEKSGAQNEVVVSFNNTAESTQTVERARISFFFQDQNSGRATEAVLGTETFDVPGAAKSPGISIGTGAGQTVDIAFDNPDSGKSINAADTFFILTLWFDGVGQETYFIAVEPSGGGGDGGDGGGGGGGGGGNGNENNGNGNNGNGNGP